MTVFDPRQDELREDDLGRALRALPLARAPRTLAPSVMAVVRATLASGRATRQDRTWFDWPLWARVSSLAGLAALVAAVYLGGPIAEAAVARAAATDTWRLSAQFLRTVWLPVVLGLTAFVTLVALVCATFGALLGRVAMEEAPQ